MFLCVLLASYVTNCNITNSTSTLQRGVFRWFGEKRRLEFDFFVVKVFGKDVTNLLPTDIKKKAGLLVDENDTYKKQPAFAWIEVNDCIAIARGAGGGVALWRRLDTMPTMIAPDGNT